LAIGQSFFGKISRIGENHLAAVSRAVLGQDKSIDLRRALHPRGGPGGPRRTFCAAKISADE
jgi:hypothetical protein